MGPAKRPNAAKRKLPSVNASKSTADAMVTQHVQPPTHILVIDNGGDTIKYGFSTDAEPRTLPNLTARLQQQWTVLAGDELAKIQNPNQLINVTRSTERGVIVNLGNQIQVWKRMLDLLGITIPLNTDTAQAMGWKQAKKQGRSNVAEAKSNSTPKISSASCAVLLTVPPHCPRTILDHLTLIWMQDFGVSHVGFVTAQVAATHARSVAPINATCVVDVGWSASTVVPTYRHRPTDPKSIRRLPIGGRHLINMWRYYCSYRQWNLMDQEWILRQVLEKSGYVSLNFNQEMNMARKIPAGQRPFDREFLLPDYHATFEGEIQLPPALQQTDEEAEEVDDDDDEDDEDVREEDMDEEDVELDLNEDADEGQEEKTVRKIAKGKRQKTKNEGDEEDESDDDDSEDEEENVEAIRQQLLKQRAEEERNLRTLEAERQVLRLSVERFAVPEVLFRPSDGGLPLEWPGLAGTIVQAIEQTPEQFRAALYQSIRLIGGLSQLPNLKERLEKELRALVPSEYDLCITKSESPVEETWYGAKAFATSSMYTEWSISQEEWSSSSKISSWQRLIYSEGGTLV